MLKEEGPTLKTKKRASDLAAYLLKTAKFGKVPKKKKIDLAVTHTKCDIVPRNERV